jgi:DoxX-like protein
MKPDGPIYATGYATHAAHTTFHRRIETARIWFEATGEAMNTPAMHWTGRVLSGLFVLFMLGASIAPKLLRLPVADETMAQLGWPAGFAFTIGLIELACVVLYLVPRTRVLGALLTMALFGGAMATQLRAGGALFSHVLFSVYLAVFMWGGLWLRDPRLRDLLPLSRGQ